MQARRPAGWTAYDSISHFELTLSYTGAGSCTFGFPGECWWARPASSATIAVSTYSQMELFQGNGTETFAFYSGDLSSNNVFNDIVSNQNFFLWFAESSSGADEFNLRSASLSVFGEPATSVPAPAPLALLLGGLGLIAAARRKPQA